MKRNLIALVVAALVVSNSYAQYVGTLPPNLEAGFNYTTDSDKFTTNAWNVGAAISNGFGIRYSESRANGPYNVPVDGDYRFYNDPFISNTRFSFSSTSPVDITSTSKTLNATYVNVGEDYEFRGAVGAKQIDAAASVSIPNLYTITATSSYDVAVMDAELRLTLTDSLTMGATLTRDVVESAGNYAKSTIDGTAPVMVTTASIDVDLQMSDNLSIYNQIGVNHFSNDNDRWFVHSKITYVIFPEDGVSLYTRVKYQYDTNPIRPTYVYAYADIQPSGDPASSNNMWINARVQSISPYFSPDQRYSVLPGIQIRQAHNGLVYTASAEVGKQWTTVVGDTSTATIYSWQLGIQTQPGKRTGNTFGVNVFGTNASQLSGSPNYHWYGLYSWIKVPF